MNEPQILKEPQILQRNPNYEGTKKFKRKTNFVTNLNYKQITHKF